MTSVGWTVMQHADVGIYMVKKGEDTIEFHNVELAPPSGSLGINYARLASIDIGIFNC